MRSSRPAEAGSASAEALRPEGREFPRILGRYSAGPPGPLMLITGGMHGNEPGGALAMQRVFRRLEEDQPKMRGRLTGMVGNLQALAHGRRFLDRDLNRIWSAPAVEACRRSAPEDDLFEGVEQRELLAAIEAEIDAPWERVVFLDLHSTSAAGPPFALMADTLQNRRIAFAFGLPVILGLEENVDGTLLGYFGDMGHVAVGLEGGQHDLPNTVDHHESAIWLALVAGGLLKKSAVPDLELHRARLDAASEGVPRVVEIRHRHGIAAGEDFRMKPGFLNFQRVKRGLPLASVGLGNPSEVRAPMSGILLLPRYQGLGQEGFFLGRSVNRFWLQLSAALRHLRLEGILTWLPGVRRRPGEPGVLEADPKVARWLATQLFHLFGYRRCRPDGGRLVFSRREEGSRRRARA